MHPSDFVGFIISFFAIIFLFLNKKRGENKNKRPPEEVRRERVERIRQEKKILKMMGVAVSEEDEEEEEEIKMPSRSPSRPAPIVYSSSKPMPKHPPSVASYYSDAPAYHAHKREPDSRGRVLIDQLSSKQKLVIYKEIFDQPLAMRGR